jgi:hypothetical protein
LDGFFVLAAAAFLAFFFAFASEALGFAFGAAFGAGAVSIFGAADLLFFLLALLCGILFLHLHINSYK